MEPEGEHLTVTRVDLDHEECRLGLRFPGPTEAQAFADAVSALLDQELFLELRPVVGGPPENGDHPKPDVPGLNGDGHAGGTTNGGPPENGGGSDPDLSALGTDSGTAVFDGPAPTPAHSEVEVLARGLRHDLENPLAAVASYLEMLQDEAELSDDARSYLDEAVEGIARVEDILEAVGEYEAVGNEEAEAVDLDEALDDAIENLGDAADGATIDREPLPTVRGLPGNLSRLFQNLLENALRYAGDQARIQVTGTRLGDRWVLRVADDGPGIPEADQQGIFEPFERGSSATGTDGSGLGLALCRRVAEAHGGTIDVLSAPGQGATFKVVLPATDDVPASLAA